MTLYELTEENLREIPPTSFAQAAIRERDDLQRILRTRIEAVAPDCLVLAEEFADWSDSRLRIDLLCLDRDARLVVVELKRTDNGGAMELQALRYAAMVSTMTLEAAVRAHARFREATGLAGDAQAAILEHLGWSAVDDAPFAIDVRIVLVAADFSRELLTSVLWLNERDLDIRCVRLRPHDLDGRTLLDVEQIVPLPAASDYLVRVKEKEQVERERTSGRDFTKYDLLLDGKLQYEALNKRHAALRFVRLLADRGVDPEQVAHVARTIGKRMLYSLDGKLPENEFILAGLARAERGEGAFNPARWFCSESELIRFGGKTHAVTNQWGQSLEPFFDACERAFPHSGVMARASSKS